MQSYCCMLELKGDCIHGAPIMVSFIDMHCMKISTYLFIHVKKTYGEGT